ncbi:MAG TPA: hypothetical protein VL172_11190 [Kofleriaceae bacterium]|nr:hypothetical protein [Kofleriaceae bacterium]
MKMLFAVAALAGACSQAARPEARDDWTSQPHRQQGESVAAPPGAVWTTAYATSEYSPPEPGFHERGYGELTFQLHLVVGGEERTAVIDERDTIESSDAELKALAAAPPRLRPAPDGHALAVSLDRSTWLLAVVDAGGDPVVCPHRAVDPDHLPATRDFVLELLRAPDPHWVLRGARTPRAQEWSDREIDGALRYAAAHADDVELRAAWAEYLVRPGHDFPYGDDVVAPILAWIRTVACDDDRMRATLLRALATTDEELHHQRSRAARGLVRCARADVQEALAGVVRRELARTGTPDDPFYVGEVVWSLAAETAQRTQAPPEILALLLALAREPDRTSDNTGRAMRIYAIRALATIPGPEVTAALQELARAEPRPYARAIDPWPAEFSVWNENMGGEPDIAMWARAALVARGAH